MRLRLIRKLADEIDGVDLKSHQVGDLLDLSVAEGRLLIAERWAIPERRNEQRLSSHPIKSVSQDSSTRKRVRAARPKPKGRTRTMLPSWATRFS